MHWQRPPEISHLSSNDAPTTFVVVRSNDGQRHPARIEQIAGGQYLVLLGNGQQHWVPVGVVTAT
jgi:hypothetical protein